MAFRSCCLHLAPTSLEQGSVLSSSRLFLSMPSEAHVLSESSWLVPQRDRWRHSNACLHYVWKHTAWPKKQPCTGIFLILCLEFILKNKQRKKKFKPIDVKHTQAVRRPVSDSAFIFFPPLRIPHLFQRPAEPTQPSAGVFFFSVLGPVRYEEGCWKLNQHQQNATYVSSSSEQHNGRLKVSLIIGKLPLSRTRVERTAELSNKNGIFW